MKKESILYGIIGLLGGLLIAGTIATLSVNNDNRSIMRMMGMDMSRVRDKSAGHMGMSMNGMQAQLQGKVGDEFDKNFIDMMIAHHEGAVDMAKQAQQSAKHDEIKRMADDIIEAQTEEIDTMKMWQAEWGYGNTPQSPMMSHRKNKWNYHGTRAM